MAERQADVCIVGGGPAGYVAALRAAQLGMKATVVEQRAAMGGTCLHVGCIPSKALLASSEHFAFAAKHFATHGILADEVRLDLGAMMRRKEKVVAGLARGIDFLFKKNGVDRVEGLGRLVAPGVVEATPAHGEPVMVRAAHVVIATGSAPASLPFLAFDGARVVNSNHAIALRAVPRSLLVIGAGAIGLELGSVWNRLGAEVTVLEFLPRVAAGFDADVSSHLQRAFEKQGMRFFLGARVEAATVTEAGVTVTAEVGGSARAFEAEVLLVAVGRRPATQNLGLEEAGVELTEKGFIKIDEHFRTSVAGVYAIGDVVGGAMLAHKAEEEGVALAEQLAGKPGHVNYDLVPNVVYTMPEAAGVGLTEEQARERGFEVRAGKFSFMANGRALANDMADGFVKIVTDAATDRVLGVSIVAANASELIAQSVTLMEFGGSAEDLARTMHAHPTMAEAVKEAAWAAFNGSPLHG